MSFGSEVRKARRKYNLSQRELAKRVEITQAQIARIENNQIMRPNQKTIYNLCKLLSLDTELWMKEFGYSYDKYVPNRDRDATDIPSKEIIWFLGYEIPIDELEGNELKTIIQILMKYV